MRKPVDFAEFPEKLAKIAPFGPHRGIVKHITDGDTFEALVDRGFNDYSYMTFRFEDINAPEFYKGSKEERALGRISKEALARFIPPGTPVILDTVQDPEKYGRYLVDVTFLRNGELTELDKVLVEEGYAKFS